MAVSVGSLAAGVDGYLTNCIGAHIIQIKLKYLCKTYMCMNISDYVSAL